MKQIFREEVATIVHIELLTMCSVFLIDSRGRYKVQKLPNLVKKFFILVVLILFIVSLLTALVMFWHYRLDILGASWLLAACIFLYISIKHRLEYGEETPLPWWKRYYVILTLTGGSWAIMLFLGSIINDRGSNLLIGSLLILFVLLSIGLSIYSVVLSLKRRRVIN